MINSAATSPAMFPRRGSLGATVGVNIGRVARRGISGDRHGDQEQMSGQVQLRNAPGSPGSQGSTVLGRTTASQHKRHPPQNHPFDSEDKHR